MWHTDTMEYYSVITMNKALPFAKKKKKNGNEGHMQNEISEFPCMGKLKRRKYSEQSLVIIGTGKDALCELNQRGK